MELQLSLGLWGTESFSKLLLVKLEQTIYSNLQCSEATAGQAQKKNVEQRKGSTPKQTNTHTYVLDVDSKGEEYSNNFPHRPQYAMVELNMQDEVCGDDSHEEDVCSFWFCQGVLLTQKKFNESHKK